MNEHIEAGELKVLVSPQQKTSRWSFITSDVSFDRGGGGGGGGPYHNPYLVAAQYLMTEFDANALEQRSHTSIAGEGYGEFRMPRN